MAALDAHRTPLQLDIPTARDNILLVRSAALPVGCDANLRDGPIWDAQLSVTTFGAYFVAIPQRAALSYVSRSPIIVPRLMA
jgi:hypothetical protein